MSNWLQRPTTQHLLTTLGAVGAGIALQCYFPDGWIYGTASTVGGVGGNLISNFLAKFFDRREADPTRPDINHDILKLISNAIAREIADCSRDDTLPIDTAERSRLLALANKAAGTFEQLMHAEELPDIAPPDVKQLLTDAARDQALPPVGKIEDWRRLVVRLANHCNVGLNTNTMVLVAQRLHTHLWESIRSELKKDFAADGRAYAALHLSFMGDVLATLNTLIELPRAQTQLTQELLEELREHKASYADPRIHTLLATLAREEAERVAEFRKRFDQVEVHLQQVLDNQAKTHSTVTKIETTVTKFDTKLDNLADMLLSRMSEKDQEIGSLKAQLEAALQRAAQAQRQGDPTATTALAELRKNGDPKALGSFLDQQLEEKLPDVIELLRERAAVAYVSGEIDRAEQCLRQILATLPADLDATNRLGHVYQLHGDLDAASRQYQRILELAPEDQSWKARSLNNLGIVAHIRGQLNDAERLFSKALTLNLQLRNLEGQAAQLGNLGRIANTRGRFHDAERFLRDALEIYKQLDNLGGQAFQLGNLGLLAYTQDQLDDAERLYREALTIDQQLGHFEGQATHLGNLGRIAYTQDQLDNAERLFRESLGIYKQLGHLEGQATHLGNLGLIAQAQGQLDDAECLYREALTIDQQLGRLEGQAAHLGNLGILAEQRGQLDNAERLHRESLVIEKQLGHLKGQALTLGNLGLIAQRQGQLDEAKHLYCDALTIYQQLNLRGGQATQLGNLGDLARIRGELDEAEDLCRSALTIGHQIGSRMIEALQLTTLGEIAEARDNFNEARRLWTEAHDLFARVGAKPQLEVVQGWLDALPPG